MRKPYVNITNTDITNNINNNVTIILVKLNKACITYKLDCIIVCSNI